MEILFLLREMMSPLWLLLVIFNFGLLGFAALVIDHRAMIVSTWRHPLTKIVVVLISGGISVYSLNYADDMIVQYSLLAPSTFTRAQTVLASAIAPILWISAFAFVLAGLYLVQAFLMIRGILLSSKRFLRFKPYRVLSIAFSLPRRPLPEPNTWLEVSKLAGLAVVTVIITPFVLRLAASDEFSDPLFRKMFIVSSFYTNYGACPPLPKTAKISLLDDGMALYVADPDALTFRLTRCAIP